MKLLIIVLFLYVAITNAIWVREMEGKYYQGDMQLRPDQMQAIKGKGKNSFASIISYRWPNGIVPYVIGNVGADGGTAVRAAIAEYHRFTCLKFVQRTNQREYLYFINGAGCSSPVGWNNRQFTSDGINRVTLASGCRTKGIAMHEIGHSIGLYHEQSRSDRDQHVWILKHNLYDPKMGYNFDKLSSSTINSLGFAYDYSSMMHYDSTAFGCNSYGQNCKMTIQTKDATKQNVIGQRNGFSQGDIDQINKMYNCKNGGTGTGGGGSCQDKDNSCLAWAKSGECDKNPDWMWPNCKKSCVAEAGDRDTNCGPWATSGECNKNPEWMKVNCKKSCKIC